VAADRYITYDDFSGGYAGALPSYRLRENQWHGLNVVPAIDGALVPRSGLVRYLLTGIGNGQIVGMGWADGGAGPDKAWFVQGTTLYNFDPYDPTGVHAVVAATGSFATAPTRVLHAWDEAGFVWIVSYGDKVYKYDLTANTLSAVANTSGLEAGRCITSWGSFLITGGSPTDPPTLYWSDGDDLGAWPPVPAKPTAGPNYVQIGSLNSAITGIYVLRGQLIVAKDDGSWWVITGDLTTSLVPDAAFNVRNVFNAQTPLQEPQHGAVIGGQAVWMVDRSAPWPSWMNGSTISDLNYLQTDLVPVPNGGTQPSLNVTRMTGPSDLLIAAGSVGRERLMFKDSIWSRHVFATITNPGLLADAKGTPPYPGDQFSTPLEWTAPMIDNLMLMSDGGDSTHPPKFYVWDVGGNDPPDDSAPLQSVTDDGYEYPNYWQGPEWVNEQGVEVLARAVTIDFRRADQGAGAPSQGFAVQVASTRRTRDETGTRWSQVQRWGGPARTVDQDRVTLMLGDQGNGAGVLPRLFDIRGVGIQRVTLRLVQESERAV